MFVSKYPPIQYKTGDIVNPEGINENTLYTAKAIQELADREVYRWTTSYNMLPDTSTPLTSATNLGYRRIAIPEQLLRSVPGAGAPITIESISTTAYYQGNDGFQIEVTGPIGSTPQTITFPERVIADATIPYTDVTLFNTQVNSFGQVLEVTVPVGTIITKLDITVGYAVNKYEAGWYSSFFNAVGDKPTVDVSPYLVSNNSTLDATNLSDLQNFLVSTSTEAGLGMPSRWAYTEFTNITSGTSQVLREKVIPDWTSAAFSSTNTAPTAIGIAGAVYVTGFAPGDIFTYEWVDSAGVAVPGWSATIVLGSGTSIGYNFGFKKSGVTAVQYSSDVNNLATDRYIRISVTGAGTIERAMVYLTYQ